MTRAVTLFTPTYARNFEHFCLQRESIERCGIELAHVAVVNHEDMELFDTVKYRKRLRIVSARDVLPPSYDKRRQVWKVSRRDYRYWITGRGIHGWLFQQLLKLAAPCVVDTDGIVCLDSDTFFIDHVSSDDFFELDNRLHLYETTDDLDTEMAEWHAHSLRFLGQKVTGVPLRRYTYSPVPMHRQLLLELQELIEHRYSMRWMDAIIDGDRIMEYTTYGVFARHVDGLKRVTPVRPSLTLNYWWREQADQIESMFESQAAQANAKIVLINSNIGLPVESYRGLAAKAWKRAIAAS